MYDIRTLLGPGAKKYTEIGSYLGSSAALLLQHPNPTTVTCIDPCNLQTTQEIILRQNLNLVNIYKRDIFIHKKYSTDHAFVQQLKKDGFTTDILFIDGNHSRKGVMSDFNSFHEFVSPGGYIVFDDYNDSKYSPQVRGAVDTIVEQIQGSKYEIVGALKNYQGALPQVTPDDKSNEFILKKA